MSDQKSNSNEQEERQRTEDLLRNWYGEIIDENYARTEQSIGPKCYGKYGGDD